MKEGDPSLLVFFGCWVFLKPLFNIFLNVLDVVEKQSLDQSKTYYQCEEPHGYHVVYLQGMDNETEQ